jgi:hypothetical protein
MGRTITAVLLGLMGATALVTSAFQPWYGNRDPKEVPLLDLVPGLDGDAGNAATSMLLPLVAAAIIVVVALVLRAKALMALAGVIGLATAVLWFVQLDRAEAAPTFQFTDFDPGLWSVSAALFLVAVATAVLPRGRTR